MRNSKYEILNSKQIPMTKIPNELGYLLKGEISFDEL